MAVNVFHFAPLKGPFCRVDKRQMELSHYADGVQWHFSLALDPSQEAENYTQLDERAAWFYEAQATSRAWSPRRPALAQSISAPTRTKTAPGSTEQGHI